MPMTPSAERPLEEIRARSPAPIDDTWKDEFVESLLRELRRQLQQLQNAAPTAESDQAGIRALNVATLARIERSLDRLTKMHEARALKRDLTMAAKNDDARAALERRLDELLEAGRARRSAEGHDE